MSATIRSFTSLRRSQHGLEYRGQGFQVAQRAATATPSDTLVSHRPHCIERPVAAGIHRSGQDMDIGIPSVKLFREKVVPANHQLAEPRQTPRE
jgi:hypothetical protein